MKLQFRTLAFVYLFAFSVAVANDGKYVEAMQKNIKTIYEAKTISDFQQAVNAFERIASVETAKWEPLYYVAFGNIMMSNAEGDKVKKDQYLDLASEAISKAAVINANESEIVALEGFVLMMRISIDPQSRGMMYAPGAMQAFNKALSLNPGNPRAMALLAQMQFGSAQFFGSPVTEACALNAKAHEQILKYRSENPLAPSWGKGMIESLMERCK
jgi:tetratricopeptide (TPR) repeat protein